MTNLLLVIRGKKKVHKVFSQKAQASVHYPHLYMYNRTRRHLGRINTLPSFLRHPTLDSQELVDKVPCLCTCPLSFFHYPLGLTAVHSSRQHRCLIAYLQHMMSSVH